MSNGTGRHYSAVVIGSGFGGTATALTLARVFQSRGRGETVHMLERGTWWTTPVGTVGDKERGTYTFLRDTHGQPVQFWSSAENFRGLLDIILRCVRRPKNEDGLYDIATFERRPFLGLFGGRSDGVSILRACGVGGGSLVYANVTIRPPDFIFDDPRWPLTWTPTERNDFYDMARYAIGYGVLAAWQARAATPPSWETGSPPPGNLSVNAGLSNIATRSARLDPHFDPHWATMGDPTNRRDIKRINLEGKGPDPENRLWIDRARVLQTALHEMTGDYGTVDSSINDLPPGKDPVPGEPPPAPTFSGKPTNYCERHGRCIVGCLPGARHTLNKQLMAAMYGSYQKPDVPGALADALSLEALAEVVSVHARDDGAAGYEIRYRKRRSDAPERFTAETLTADRVIVAAGCVGTNELLLRSKTLGGLPHLSERVGCGFSTNGDYLAFLDGTRERVSLTRGPVTTSYGHFHTMLSQRTNGPAPDPAKFHTIEDNGMPRAFSSVTGVGVPLLRRLAAHHHPRIAVMWAIVRAALKRIPDWIHALRTDYHDRHELFFSEDEWTANMMCVAAMGREAAVGRFRLGGDGETPLRVRREDGLDFAADPIYREIESTLTDLAVRLTGDQSARFYNPFVKEGLGAFRAAPIALSHPLGGCRMARTATEGAVDEFGRAFHTVRGRYPGLYVADASIVATSLGVNPSLTITALALRIADNIVRNELPV